MSAFFSTVIACTSQRNNMPGQRCEVISSKGPPKAIEPADSGADFRAAYVRDAPATLLEKVRGCQCSHRFVVHTDKMGVEPLEAPVDQDVRSVLLLKVTKAINRSLRRCNQHYINPPCQQVLDLLHLQLRVLVRRGDEQTVAVLSRPRGDGIRNICEEGMQKIRHNEPQSPGLACRQ